MIDDDRLLLHWLPASIFMAERNVMAHGTANADKAEELLEQQALTLQVSWNLVSTNEAGLT